VKLSEWLERYEIKDDFVPAHPHAADVIIGIGTDVSRDGRKVSPQSAAIVETIADFYSCFRSEDILFTGGYSYKGGPTEAETMYDHLITLMTAADKKDIKHLRCHSVLEKKSSRTYLNADYALPILQEKGWKTAIIVAQQWHARRVRATFKKRWAGSGIKFAVIKARSPYSGDNSQWRWRGFWRFLFCWEVPVWLYSKLKGYC